MSVNEKKAYFQDQREAADIAATVRVGELYLTLMGREWAPEQGGFNWKGCLEQCGCAWWVSRKTRLG